MCTIYSISVSPFVLPSAVSVKTQWLRNFLALVIYLLFTTDHQSVIYEGHSESSKHGIITPQCVDKMLSNSTFLKTRIQRRLDGLIFVEKGLVVHVQRMLKMSRFYSLAEILSQIFK